MMLLWFMSEDGKDLRALRTLEIVFGHIEY